MKRVGKMASVKFYRPSNFASSNGLIIYQPHDLPRTFGWNMVSPRLSLREIAGCVSPLGTLTVPLPSTPF